MQHITAGPVKRVAHETNRRFMVRNRHITRESVAPVRKAAPQTAATCRSSNLTSIYISLDLSVSHGRPCCRHLTCFQPCSCEKEARCLPGRRRRHSPDPPSFSRFRCRCRDRASLHLIPALAAVCQPILAGSGRSLAF